MDRRAFLSGAAAALSSAAWAGPAAAQTKQLTLGQTSKSATDWGLYVADKAGFFTTNGLQVDAVVIGSSAGCAQQLTAGSIDVGSVSSTQVIEAVIGGAPMIEVINEVITAPYFLLARKGVTSLAQLKGKTIIIGGPNDITRVFTDKVLTANGFKPEDISYTYAGASGDRYAALLSGGVDASILLPPFAFRAADQGYAVVAEVQKYFPKFPFGGLAARSAWAKTHRDTVVAFDKSYLQGVRWLFDPANRSRAIQILIEETNAADDDANKTYDLYVTRLGLYSRTGRFADEDFTQVIDALVKTKDITLPVPPPARYYDNTYADAAIAQMRGGR